MGLVPVRKQRVVLALVQEQEVAVDSVLCQEDAFASSHYNEDTLLQARVVMSDDTCHA